MTILESLREKRNALNVLYVSQENMADVQELAGLIEQYDLALENALLKLGNRSVQIKDLKERLTKSDEAMRRIVNFVVNTPLDKRLSLPHELFVAIDKALGRPATC